MPGVKIDNMRSPLPRFMPSVMVPNYDPAEQQTRLDRRNAAQIHREVAAGSVPETKATQALAVAQLIDLGDRGDRFTALSPVPTTLASARYLSAKKDRVCGHLWSLFQTKVPNAHFFTAIPRGAEVPLQQLPSFDLDRERERFRALINTLLEAPSSGILFAVLEAEYQIEKELWRWHWHGIASGAKLSAVRKLSGTAPYRAERRTRGQPKPAVTYRVNVETEPLTSLPDPLTYLIKQPQARWTSPEGKRSRLRRVPAAANIEMLLFRHQHTLHDHALIMGMTVAQNGFDLR